MEDFTVRLHYFGRFVVVDGLLEYHDGLEAEFYVEKAQMNYENILHVHKICTMWKEGTAEGVTPMNCTG